MKKKEKTTKLVWKPSGKVWKVSRMPKIKSVSRVSVTTTVEKTIEVREDDRYVKLVFDSDWVTIDYNSNMPQKKTLDDWKFLIKALKIMIKELERNSIP